MRSSTKWSAGVALALALTAPAAAEGPAAREGEASAATAGMQIAIDPQTGRLRPTTPAEARKLLEQLRAQSPVAPRQTKATQHADGTLSVVLGEETLQMFLAKVGPDGQLVRACVDSAQAAEQFLLAPAQQLEDQ